MEHKWMKRISFFLALVMVLTMLPVTALAETLSPAPQSEEPQSGEEYVVALTAEDGGRVSGGGVYADGQEVTVTAYPGDDYTFAGWYDAGTLVSPAPVYSFTALGPVSYQACFNATVDNYALTVNGTESYTVKDEDGKALTPSAIPANTSVTLTASNDQGTFLRWVNEYNKILSTEPAYTFTMVRNATVIAVYSDSAPTVSRVVFRNAYSQIMSDYPSGDVTLPDGPAKMGYTFDYWYYVKDGEPTELAKSGVEDFNNSLTADPTTRIEVLPHYSENGAMYTINVSYKDTAGTLLETQPEEKSAVVKVGVKCDTNETWNVPQTIGDLSFLYWEEILEEGSRPVGYDRNYSVLRAQSCTVDLAAVYGEAGDSNHNPQPIVNITQTYASMSGEKYVVSNTMQYYLPEGYELVQAGFEYYTSTNNTVRHSIDSNTGRRGLFTFNARLSKPETTLSVKAFVIYKNDQGVVQPTLYSGSDWVSNSYYDISDAASVKEDKNGDMVTVAPATVQTPADNENNAPAATATIPEGVKLVTDDNTSTSAAPISLAVIVEKESVPEQVEIPAAAQQTTNFQVEIQGIDPENTKPIVVCLKAALATDLTGVKAYHIDATTNAPDPMEESSDAAFTDIENGDAFYYDAATGDLYIRVTHFSDFTFTYDSDYIKFPNVGEYLYRVGNQNPVALSTLFKNTSEIKSVAVNTVIGATGTYDGTNITFSGTGVVRLTATLTNGDTVTLPLEVVDATNATSAANATAHNVVLLGNVSVNGNGGIKIDNGYALYGNGFKVTCSGNGGANSSEGMGSGYITIAGGGTIDNVSVIAPDFPKAYMYVGSTPLDYYLRESDNTIDENHFAYQLSAVKTTGRATITNCYVYGARNNILATGGELTVDNCVLSNGSLSNIHFNSSSGGKLTINDLTTIQYLREFTYNKPNGGDQVSATVLGFGILMGPTPEDVAPNTNPELHITGFLDQYNWVCSQDSTDITSSKVAKNIISTATSKGDFRHTYGERNDYVNLGVVYLNNTPAEITDERSNHGYIGRSVSISGANGYVYSLQSSSGKVELKDANYQFSEADNGVYVPVASVDFPTTLPDTEIYCWNDKGTLRIKFPYGQSYELDLDEHITFSRYLNESTTYSVSCERASVDGHVITFTRKGSTEIVIEVSGSAVYDKNGLPVGTQDYTLRIPVEVSAPDATWKDAEISCTNNEGTIVFKRNSSDSTYGTPIFDGMTIVDYDRAGNPYTVLDGTNQQDFLNSIMSIVSNADERTGFTINFPDGTKLEISCSAPYHSQGKLKYKTATIGGVKKFMLGGSMNIKNNGYELTIDINSYTYTGHSGNPVKYNTKRTFIGTTASGDNTSFVNFETQKVLVLDPQDGEVTPEYTSKSSLTLPMPSNEGYSFRDWNTKSDGTGQGYAAGTQYTIPNKNNALDNSTTLYAIWYHPYRVAFDTSGAGECPDQVYDGFAVNLPQLELEGHWFVGWFDAPEGGNRVGGANDTYHPKKNITLYARWSPVYTVTYNTNPKDGDPSIQLGTTSAAYSGTDLVLPKPTSSIYPFLGWYTEAAGDDLVGINGDDYIPTSNITLYAHWGEPTTVTYDANEGTCPTPSASYTSEPLTLPTPTRTGYWFTGWYTASSGGTKVGLAGASYTPTESITLYAQWKPEYTVSFDANGGSVSPASMTYEGTALTLPTPTKTGHSCTWYTEGGEEVGKPGASYTPTADITLYAQWTIASYKVTISKNNSNTTVTVNGTPVTDGGSVPYNSVVQVVLSYDQTESLTFTIKQGNNNVTYYSNEACTTSANSTDAGTYYFKMPAGDVTISSSSKAPSCLPSGTLITLADGTQKPIEDIRLGDMVMTWNFDTGVMEPQPVSMYWYHGSGEYRVINLRFSNDAIVRVIAEHGFFDADLNKFVFIKESTCADYIGHRFIICNADGSYETVTLDAAYLTDEETGCYSLRTAYNDNALVEGLISLTQEDYEGITTCFEVGEGLKYDSAKKQALIDTYGLYTYDEWADYMTEDIFDMFNCQYYKIYVGLGILREEDFYSLLDGLYENLAQ